MKASLLGTDSETDSKNISTVSVTLSNNDELQYCEYLSEIEMEKTTTQNIVEFKPSAVTR